MKTIIKNIATIKTGVFAKSVSGGAIVYLQAKHFDETGKISSLLHPDLMIESINEKHFIKSGDVLFSAKGTKNFAALYENKDQPAVASTSFFVIRLHENFINKILPQFLVWFLNNPLSQQSLKAKAIGTSMASISKVVLEELEISIPSIETQKEILKITELYNQEKNLKQQIETLREKQIQQQIINAINK